MGDGNNNSELWFSLKKDAEFFLAMPEGQLKGPTGHQKQVASLDPLSSLFLNTKWGLLAAFQIT